jgi:hypothetical protein
MNSENEILQTNIREYFILLIAEYNKHSDLHYEYDKRYRLLERIMSLETTLKTIREHDTSPVTTTNKIDKSLKTIRTFEQKIIEHAILKYKETAEEKIELYNRIVEIYNNSGGVLHVAYILYYNTYKDKKENYLSYTIRKGSILESVKKIADLEDPTYIHYTLKVFEDYVENIPVDNLETELIQYIKKDVRDTTTPMFPVSIYTKVLTKDTECSIYYDILKSNLLYTFDIKNTPQLYYTFNNEERKYIIIALKHARRQWKEKDVFKT